jgi:predicted transcriptional regulator
MVETIKFKSAKAIALESKRQAIMKQIEPVAYQKRVVKTSLMGRLGNMASVMGEKAREIQKNQEAYNKKMKEKTGHSPWDWQW